MASVWLFKVGEICGEDGKKKFSKLTALVNCVLILSHGNADPEKGFSVNKHLLQIHGGNTGKETLEALRLVKDSKARKGGIECIKVTKALIRSCQSAHSLYTSELAEKKRQEKVTLDEARKNQEKEEKLKQINEIDSDLIMIKSGIEIAEKAISEGNEELELLIKREKLDRDELAKAHQKINMGVKRKTELQASLLEAEKKKKKLI